LVLKVYADESGKGGRDVFVMAGVLARAEDWASFSEDWQRLVLDVPPAVKAFHMNEIVASKDFARIKAASGVLRKYKFSAVAVSMFIDDFNVVLKGNIGPKIDTPYFPAMQMFMEECVKWQIAHGVDEPMDLTFDEQLHESDYLQSIWTPMLSAMPDAIKRKFGARPAHVNDVGHPPIQAADMLAWSMHRIEFCNARSQPLDDFIVGVFDGIPMRHLLWRREEMAAFLDYVRHQNTELGRLTQYEGEHYLRNRDLVITGSNRLKLDRAKPGETVRLVSIPASGVGRFLLVDKCPRSDMPHLHRRSGDECLGEPPK